MRKIIGIGETVLDILFNNNQPFRAVPGGSVFNSMISLSRCNQPVAFISEIGNDRVGCMMKDFLKDNNISTDHIDVFSDGSSPVSLAFLDEKQDVEYTFYRNFPNGRLDVLFPMIYEGDIVIFGSYFAVNPLLREKIKEFLDYAVERKAIIYYDINFRKAHEHERLKLMVNFIENFEYASIIRCSNEDLRNLYPNEKSIDDIYRNHIGFYCKNFIVTQGEDNIILKTGKISKTYPIQAVQSLSTIGAGDNFNAGLIYGLMKLDIPFERKDEIEEQEWDQLIAFGQEFARECCLSQDNYISEDFFRKL